MPGSGPVSYRTSSSGRPSPLDLPGPSWSGRFFAFSIGAPRARMSFKKTRRRMLAAHSFDKSKCQPPDSGVHGGLFGVPARFGRSSVAPSLAHSDVSSCLGTVVVSSEARMAATDRLRKFGCRVNLSPLGRPRTSGFGHEESLARDIIWSFERLDRLESDHGCCGVPGE
jgi:hypothetical protein